MTPLDPSFGPTYRPRDRLLGGELTEWRRAPLLAMARHFRALHRHHGVVAGLKIEIQANPQVSAFGGWTATVGPGVAYDSVGRPLVVLETDPVERRSVPIAGGRPGAGKQGSHLF